MRPAAAALLALLLAAGGAPAAEDRIKGSGKARGPDTVAVAGTRIRLAAIEVPGDGLACGGSSCAESATAALDALLTRGEVACSKERRLGHGYFLGRCMLADGTDLALGLLRDGLARPSGGDAPEAYRAAAAAAREARRGLWAAAGS
jgi:endonuclease YncB( thermonuclease family)